LWSSLYLSTPLISFGNTSSLNSNDTTGLNIEEAFPGDYSRTEPETRPTVARRNSDGDVKVLCNDENFAGCSGVRDDSDLYLTKSLVCKAETAISPSKSLLANGFDRKSNENIGGSCENNSFEHNGAADCNNETENGCENNSIGQNGLLEEDHIALNSSENTRVEQNGIPANDGDLNSSKNSENGTASDNSNGTPTDSGISTEKSCELSDSMTNSSNTVVDDTNFSNTEEVKVTRSQIENGHQVSENGSGLSQRRSASKPINCRSNHRLGHLNDRIPSLQNGSTAENHLQDVGNSFSEFGETPKSPEEMSFNKLRNYLDIDGLSLVLDPVQARLLRIERCYREKIEGLKTRLQAQGCVCGVRPTVNIQHDMV
jgi:hypothetical protein